ncbi:hypothetical protein V6N11_022276 [Hibiscus sabdariffa]|uniref:Uncharacterized protein n=1 Tax=Hibiscus sabdariffa TaxID=183260 RepID=A0ABR2TIV7_9ROSI
MEKKLDFFSGLQDEVVRGLSHSRSRSNSPARARSPMAYRRSVSAAHGRSGFGWRGSRGLEEGWVGARIMG